MTKTLLVPLQFSATGRLATTEDQRRIAEQQILDVLVTGTLQRVMRPDYGASADKLLFDPMNDLALADTAQVMVAQCNRTLNVAQVTAVRLDPRFDPNVAAKMPLAILDVEVDYVLPAQTTISTFHAAIRGVLSEESSFQ